MTLKVLLGDLVHEQLAGNRVYPLNIGYVGAYLKSQFGNDVDVRLFKSPEKLIDALDHESSPHVVGLSNYMWNRELTRWFIRKIQADHPDAIIYSGGPSVRVDNDGLAKHIRDTPGLDYYCVHDGEVPMGHIVGQVLSRGTREAKTKIDPFPGVAFFEGDTLSYERPTFHKSEITNLPSPYLTGMLDEFLSSSSWIPVFETTRGCPFRCTFCSWGVATDAVRTFPLETVLEEFEFIGRRSESPYWIFGDANFGMLKRDIEIAENIRRIAVDRGRLKSVTVFWAKNSHDNNVAATRILGDLSFANTAVQSMDAAVLAAIKRSNIRLDPLIRLRDEFSKMGRKTETDIICGLPRETFAGHCDTLREVFDVGFDTVNVANLIMLPGTELDLDSQRDEFGMKTKFRLFSGDSGIYDGDQIFETEEVVWSTSTLSGEEMMEIRKLHFLINTFWNVGFAKPLLKWGLTKLGINPVDTCLSLLERGKNQRMDAFFDEYQAEASAELFDSREELIRYYGAKGKSDEFLKLNLKMIAHMLLDRTLAGSLVFALADNMNHPAAREIARFCLEGVFFSGTPETEKIRTFDVGVTEELADSFPDLPKTSRKCRFSIDPGLVEAIQFSLDGFDVANKPILAHSKTLERYLKRFTYSFEFLDGSGESGSPNPARAD